jgi:hypothetical protein
MGGSDAAALFFPTSASVRKKLAPRSLCATAVLSWRVAPKPARTRFLAIWGEGRGERERERGRGGKRKRAARGVRDDVRDDGWRLGAGATGGGTMSRRRSWRRSGGAEGGVAPEEENARAKE